MGDALPLVLLFLPKVPYLNQCLCAPPLSAVCALRFRLWSSVGATESISIRSFSSHSPTLFAILFHTQRGHINSPSFWSPSPTVGVLLSRPAPFGARLDPFATLLALFFTLPLGVAVSVGPLRNNARRSISSIIPQIRPHLASGIIQFFHSTRPV